MSLGPAYYSVLGMCYHFYIDPLLLNDSIINVLKCKNVLDLNPNS